MAYSRSVNVLHAPWERPGGVGDNGLTSQTYMQYMKSEQHRLESYRNWLPSRTQRPKELAQAGLFYTNISDRVQCPFCCGVLKNWLPTDDPYFEHSRHFPYCRFIRGLDVGNIPTNSNISALSVPLYASHHDYFQRSEPAVNIIPSYATNVISSYESYSRYSSDNIDLTIEENRLKTFSRWPPNVTQIPSELARAGFYHIPSEGKPDKVRCAYCKGKLFNWEPDDDPWIEHKRCFPDCGYIKLCMGSDVSNTGQSANCSTQEEERPSVSPPPPEPPPPGSGASSSATENDDSLTARMKSESVEAILEMGFSVNLVRNVVKKCLDERPGNFPHAEELASMVMELEDPQPAASAHRAATPLQRMMAAAAMGAQNSSSSKATDKDRIGSGSRSDLKLKTKDRFLCKICMENQVRVTFMPCGHLACCGPCSMTLTECPICRTYITDWVRTYF